MSDDFRCQVKQIIADFKAAERITGDISVGIVAVAVALWAVLLAGTMALQAELFYFAAKKIGIGRGIVAATAVAGGPFYLPARWRCSDSRFQAQTCESMQPKGQIWGNPCIDS